MARVRQSRFKRQVKGINVCFFLPASGRGAHEVVAAAPREHDPRADDGGQRHATHPRTPVPARDEPRMYRVLT